MSRGGGQHLLGPEHPQKSIDFTGPEGGLALKAPPPEYASGNVRHP